MGVNREEKRLSAAATLTFHHAELQEAIKLHKADAILLEGRRTGSGAAGIDPIYSFILSGKGEDFTEDIQTRGDVV